MALEYFNYMRGSPEEFTMGHAFEAAQATWDTDWLDDPSPRTIDAGILAAQDDLSYWNEE